MVIRLPNNSRWNQPNSSDKFGNINYSKNINLDEEGYIKLSPRSVIVMDDDTDGQFGFPLAIGRQGQGQYQVGTSTDANFTATVAVEQNSWDENDGTSNPTMTINSDGAWYQGLWHASTATTVVSRPATGGSNQAWTSRITGLTSGKRHIIRPFVNKRTICVANGNVVKQYDSSYASTVDLTIPTDFEVVTMAYNNAQMAIGTRLSNDGTVGQDQDAYFFIWDGATTEANAGLGVGSDSILWIEPYKTSFIVLTRSGELSLWNGGGLTKLAAFPFYFTDKIWGNELSTNALGNSPMEVDGDVVYINVGLTLNDYGRNEQNRDITSPSGVWCYDPAIGLYHRWSPSISRAYVNYVSSANINTTTNILTASAGVYGLETIPATGNIARLASTAGIGGLTLNQDYYIIKVSSTEFKLATSKDNALTGNAIDITSATSGDNFFWMYDLKDYGQTHYDNAGAIAKVGDTKAIYRDIIFGGRYTKGDNTTVDALCLTVPFLENRGYIVTPKIFSSQAEDVTQTLLVRFRPLKSTDSIVVSQRKKDVSGLPVSSSGSVATWTGTTEFYTSQSLADAKTYLDAGGSLEAEITAGVGAGQCVQITEITTGSGVYTVALEEDVLGAASGQKSEFIIQNWEKHKVITSENNGSGYLEIPINKKSKWEQFKIELRGDDVAIESLDVINATHKKLE